MPVLERAGRPDEALKSYRQASATCEKTAAADTANELARRFPGFSHEHAGKLLIKTGKVNDGLAEIRKALAVFHSFSQTNTRHDFVL